MECYFLSTSVEIVECFKECVYYNGSKENPTEDCPFAQVFNGKSYKNSDQQVINN
ncbi:hypothetical protein [Candidatus Arthromitus sp. SFB-rat-Yit]|uniref:hypothetical protein n=1 Tax=Candidatus Arthromitus sp. SFB-rat-Yit TaxID=1041504 RepID=UPI000227A273|nr:hypothetical protein [Candidatus Arthromitus sp. SFB-rat-Yit]BAK80802.1 hypothetical protein RATSFB_0240 [Candidatus Arthromitus sp. SFB-rat-Yit]